MNHVRNEDMQVRVVYMGQISASGLPRSRIQRTHDGLAITHLVFLSYCLLQGDSIRDPSKCLCHRRIKRIAVKSALLTVSPPTRSIRTTPPFCAILAASPTSPPLLHVHPPTLISARTTMSEGERVSAAETVWGIPGLRQELFKWEVHSRMELSQMMVIEKRSLPTIAAVLYKKVKTVDLVKYLRQRGCAEVSRELPLPVNGLLTLPGDWQERVTMYRKAVQVVEETLELREAGGYDHYTIGLLLDFPFLVRATFTQRLLGEAEQTPTPHFAPWSISKGLDGQLFRGVAMSCYNAGGPLFTNFDPLHASGEIFSDVPQKVFKLLLARSSRSHFSDGSGNLLRGDLMAPEVDLTVWEADRHDFRTGPSVRPCAGIFSQFADRGVDRVTSLCIKALFPPEEMQYFRNCRKLAVITFEEWGAHHKASIPEYINQLTTEGDLPALRCMRIGHRPCCQDLPLPTFQQSSSFQQKLKSAAPHLDKIAFVLYCESRNETEEVVERYIAYFAAHLGADWVAQRPVEPVEGEVDSSDSEQEEEEPTVTFMRVHEHSEGESGPEASGVPGWRLVERA